ncbi:hypothetical protein ACTFIZ_002916 [Dictyostelium cf. discoideum]
MLVIPNPCQCYRIHVSVTESMLMLPNSCYSYRIHVSATESMLVIPNPLHLKVGMQHKDPRCSVCSATDSNSSDAPSQCYCLIKYIVLVMTTPSLQPLPLCWFVILIPLLPKLLLPPSTTMITPFMQIQPLPIPLLIT